MKAFGCYFLVIWYLFYWHRQLTWDDAATRQLIKLVLAEKLDIGMEEVEEQLEKLACLVPDLVGKLECMKVDILQAMLKDLPVSR